MDGGSGFMAELEKTCQGLGIALFLLPPRSPKLNGHVERLPRTFREGFYTRPLPTRLGKLQAKLDAYLHPYNRRRPYVALPLWSSRLGYRRGRFPKVSQM